MLYQSSISPGSSWAPLVVLVHAGDFMDTDAVRKMLKAITTVSPTPLQPAGHPPMSSPAFKCHKPPHNIEQSDRAFLPIFSPMVLAFHFIFFHILCTTKPSMRGLWDTPQWSRKRSAQEDQVHGLGGYIHEHTQAFRFALTAPHRCVSHHREPLYSFTTMVLLTEWKSYLHWNSNISIY